MTSAGGSAQREFERRKTKDAQRLRASLPIAVPFMIAAAVIGGLVFNQLSPGLGWLVGAIILLKLGADLIAPKKSTTSYATGADGERRTGEVLESLSHHGYVTLHDRRIPSSRANIDHIAIGPGGIFVIESKSYKGKVRVTSKDLFVNGRRQTRIIEQAWRESGAVQGILGPELARLSIDAVPLVCFHRAELPLGKVALEGVRIVGSRGLKKLLKSAPPRLSPDDIAHLHALADSALKPA